MMKPDELLDCIAAVELSESTESQDTTDQLRDEIERLKAELGSFEWTQVKPTAVGLYLRINPPVSFVTKIGTFIGVDGVLKVPDPEPSKIMGTAVADLSDRFWWFGPIPPHMGIVEEFRKRITPALAAEANTR